MDFSRVSAILEEAGQQLKLGGIVSENLDFKAGQQTHLNWDYGVTDKRLRTLYHKGVTAQWDGANDLPWETVVDLERPVFAEDEVLAQESWYKKLTTSERRKLIAAMNANTLSQFMHGEQGAMVVAAQLVATMPDMDGKFYASTQTMDEARHTEVFERYLREKMGEVYPFNQNATSLIQAILCESRWDFKLLGMQIMLEGFALAAFVSLMNNCNEPLLKKLIRLVLQDEARHVAYGVVSLKNLYDDMSEKDVLERQEFIYESTRMIGGRLMSTQPFQRMGISKEVAKDYLVRSKIGREFEDLMWMNVLPNLKKIGLLTGFLKEKYGEMGLLKYGDFDHEAMLDGFIYEGQDLKGQQAAG